MGMLLILRGRDLFGLKQGTASAKQIRPPTNSIVYNGCRVMPRENGPDSSI